MKRKFKKKFCFLFLLVGFVFFCNAQDSVNSFFSLYPQSGSYGQGVTCTLRTKSINTVQVKINEKDWTTVSSVWSGFLDSADETENSFLVSVRVFETNANSKVIYEQKFNYKIDKCYPSVPSFWFKRLDSGYQVFFDTEEKESVVRYSIFDIVSEKRIDGIISEPKTQSIVVNNNSVLYAIEIDSAGNSSSPLLYDFSVGIAYSDDFSIINPAPGKWNNEQTLVVSQQGKNDLVYTTNGDDPRKNGISYTKPITILGDGEFTVRVYDKISHIEKQVKFSQNSSSMQDSSVMQNMQKDETIMQDDSSVQNVLKSNILGFQITDGVVKIPQSTKLNVPQNLIYGFGKNADLIAKSGEIQIPVIENCYRYLPMIVSQNDLQYRFVLLVGEEKENKVLSSVNDESSGINIISTPYSHILSFPENSKYSVDSGSWLQTETLPVILNRKYPHEIRWQSVKYKDNEIQHFFLSGKTSSENLVKFVKDKTDALKIEKVDKDIELHYELSFDNFPPTVTDKSPSLTDNFVLDVPQGDQVTVLIRIAGFAGKDKKVITGEFVSTLSIDRKLPEKPTFVLDGTNKDDAWSRESVTVSWNYPDVGDILYAGIATKKIETGDLNFTSQWPAVTTFDSDKRLFVIDQDEDSVSNSQFYATAYTVSAYIEDAAGNKSPVTTFHGVLNKNAWYVSSNKTSEKIIPDGTPEAPFSSIEEALNNIKDVSSDSFIVLYVSGDLNLDESQDLSKSVFIMKNPSEKQRPKLNLSQKTTINIVSTSNIPVRVLFKGVEIVKNSEKNNEYNSVLESEPSVFFVNNANLELSDVVLKSNQKTELLTVLNSTVKVNGSKLILDGQNSDICGSFKNSIVNFIGSDIYVSNKSFAQGLDISGGNCSFKNGSITLFSQAGAALGISLDKSELVVDASVFILKTASAGRCVESWNSVLSFSDSIFGLFDENKKIKNNSQEKCIWIDEYSKIERDFKNKISGFNNFK